MYLLEFSHYLNKLEQTTSRNEITRILASLFKKTSAKEIDKVCYLSLGSLTPAFRGIEFNIAEKTITKTIALAFNLPTEKVVSEFKQVGDLGKTAFNLRKKQKGPTRKITINKIYNALLEITQETGGGSQERKIKLMAQLIQRVNPNFLKYLARIPTGKLRLGFSETTILDALSWMEKGDKSLRPQIENAYNVAADIGLIAKVFKTKGPKGLKNIRAKPGIPILPARAGRLPTAEKIIQKLGECAAEPKFDGFRVQIHVDRHQKSPSVLDNKQNSFLTVRNESLVQIFSRNLENTTRMFPDIVKGCRKLLLHKTELECCIFDCEAIGYNPKTKKFLPFQETAQRKRKYDIARLSKEVPLLVFVFDLLLYNGQSFLQKPFRKRREILEQILDIKNPILKLAPQKLINNPNRLQKEFYKAAGRGLEGLMCKKLDSAYQAGARNFNWVKYKKSMESKLVDTLDCLIMGYYRGKGKRAKFGIGAFLVGIYDKRKDRFNTIAKIGTGLTDSQWRQMRKKCDHIKVNKKPKQYLVNKSLAPDVWCQPVIVVEIQADEITKSPVHAAAGGFALRFPRLKKFRAKNPKDTTSDKELLEIYRMQK